MPRQLESLIITRNTADESNEIKIGARNSFAQDLVPSTALRRPTLFNPCFLTLHSIAIISRHPERT
jgi:hypothetical protein